MSLPGISGTGWKKLGRVFGQTGVDYIMTWPTGQGFPKFQPQYQSPNENLKHNNIHVTCVNIVNNASFFMWSQEKPRKHK